MFGCIRQYNNGMIIVSFRSIGNCWHTKDCFNRLIATPRPLYCFHIY